MIKILSLCKITGNALPHNTILPQNETHVKISAVAFADIYSTIWLKITQPTVK
jgi:hypothetical protein